jgi:adenine-specific DNA methylase
VTQSYKKKLIEVAIPLEAINEAAMKEKSNPFLKGHLGFKHQVQRLI